jgi:hypothetical protein
MPNTNCLEGIRCPRCRYESEFYISCSCNQCGYVGPFRAFSVENQIAYANAVSLVREFIDTFPELDSDGDLNGADCVERVAELRARAKAKLPEAQKGGAA